jgi:Protein of unknown function (DUF2975)
MPTAAPDPLLIAARFLLSLVMGVLALVAGGLVIGIPAVLSMRDKVLAHIATQGTPPDAIWAIVAAMAMAAMVALLGFLFFRHLFRIVGSVAEGDAFAPINAQRLSAMGWIAVAVQILGIPMLAVVSWIDSVTKDVEGSAHLSASGILLAMILFILARVFREGTRMRDELEGTV